MNREILFKGFHPCENGKDRVFINGEWINGKWVEGAYITMHHNDGRTHLHHFIIPDNSDLSYGVKVEDILVEVIPETVGRCSGRCDISGQLMFEGDIFEVHQGTKILAVTMILRYGIYQTYCPTDKEYMDNVGFYVEAKEYLNMPMGDTERYAKVIGNIHDNPELLEVAE